jgi:hypothetical protein
MELIDKLSLFSISTDSVDIRIRSIPLHTVVHVDLNSFESIKMEILRKFLPLLALSSPRMNEVNSSKLQ